jgi:hypothetical protein
MKRASARSVEGELFPKQVSDRDCHLLKTLLHWSVK